MREESSQVDIAHANADPTSISGYHLLFNFARSLRIQLALTENQHRHTGATTPVIHPARPFTLPSPMVFFDPSTLNPT